MHLECLVLSSKNIVYLHRDVNALTPQMNYRDLRARVHLH